MGQIQVMERPGWVSFDDVHEVLYRSHEKNRNRGLVMTTSKLTGEQLKERIGKNGKCWVAIDGDTVVGTGSVRIVKRNCWYAKGDIADYMLVGVIPEYQGKHISGMVAEQVFKYAREQGYSLVELDTAENNFDAIKIYEHQGFVHVGYTAKKGLDHYSVIMVKWLGDPPFSKAYCWMRYHIRRLLVRTRYKVGKVKRFGI